MAKSPFLAILILASLPWWLWVDVRLESNRHVCWRSEGAGLTLCTMELHAGMLFLTTEKDPNFILFPITALCFQILMQGRRSISWKIGILHRLTWFTIFLILNLGTEILNGDNHKYFSQDHSNLLQILSFTYLLIYFFYWRITALQNFVVFCQTSTIISHATVKSLQSCPTLCSPIDGNPPGSPIPGILQARTLEWVAISFSNAWKWKVKMKSLSHVRLLATPWTAAYQTPPSIGFSRQESYSGVSLPSP